MQGTAPTKSLLLERSESTTWSASQRRPARSGLAFLAYRKVEETGNYANFIKVGGRETRLQSAAGFRKWGESVEFPLLAIQGIRSSHRPGRPLELLGRTVPGQHLCSFQLPGCAERCNFLSRSDRFDAMLCEWRTKKLEDMSPCFNRRRTDRIGFPAVLILRFAKKYPDDPTIEAPECVLAFELPFLSFCHVTDRARACAVKSCSGFPKVPTFAGDFNKWLLSCIGQNRSPKFPVLSIKEPGSC